jgi:hypothetical protein
MPLIKGYSAKTIGHNIATEMAAGKSHAQAVAIALNTAHSTAQGRGTSNRVHPHVSQVAKGK